MKTLLLLQLVAVVGQYASVALANAPAGRYIIATDTVYDSRTKLTWQRNSPSVTYTPANAKAYCAGMGASLGGTGWRLPTRGELQTIVDYSLSMPAIDTTVFGFLSTSDYVFWSSSYLEGSAQTSAWYVGFADGKSQWASSTDAHSVRCVR